mmetsp:Transcript_93198/g.259613  ORF Transcript_93198/g.259613 Transcript_93198/m.259613 type:complete len:142 (-) Transcript_93198:155-580(-)
MAEVTVEIVARCCRPSSFEMPEDLQGHVTEAEVERCVQAFDKVVRQIGAAQGIMTGFLAGIAAGLQGGLKINGGIWGLMGLQSLPWAFFGVSLSKKAKQLEQEIFQPKGMKFQYRNGCCNAQLIIRLPSGAEASQVGQSAA